MKKVFIFDCGNVLFGFSREHLLDVYVGNNQNDRKLFYDYVFKDWEKQDVGMPSIDYYNEVITNLPTSLHKAAFNIIMNWKEHVWEIDGMWNLVKSLKEKGHKLILLSNMPDTFTYNHSEFTFLNHFDDLIFSFPLKLKKPDKRIFQYMIEKDNLIPSECIFIDDNIDNIESAKKLGFNTYLFDTNNPKKFIEFVKKEIE